MYYLLQDPPSMPLPGDAGLLRSGNNDSDRRELNRAGRRGSGGSGKRPQQIPREVRLRVHWGVHNRAHSQGVSLVPTCSLTLQMIAAFPIQYFG